MKPLVTQVWPQFTADQQFCAAFGSVLVERVELYRTKRQVIIRLRSAEQRKRYAGERFSGQEPAGSFWR